MTGEIQKVPEADIAHYHNLKGIVKRNRQDAMEWLKAVDEVRSSSLWMIDCATWDEFCQKNMNMSAAGIREQVRHIGKDESALLPKLPPAPTEGFGDMKDDADRMGARLKSFMKLYVELTADWPENELSPLKLREMDEDLLRWAGGFEVWLAGQSSICDASKKLEARVNARSKRRKKV